MRASSSFGVFALILSLLMVLPIFYQVFDHYLLKNQLKQAIKSFYKTYCEQEVEVSDVKLEFVKKLSVLPSSLGRHWSAKLLIDKDFKEPFPIVKGKYMPALNIIGDKKIIEVKGEYFNYVFFLGAGCSQRTDFILDREQKSFEAYKGEPLGTSPTIATLFIVGFFYFISFSILFAIWRALRKREKSD